MSNVKHKSGATSSYRALPHHLVSLALRRRIAQRYALGSVSHGEGNWLRAFADGSIDIKYLQDRYNHAVEHFSLLALEGSGKDDHIGAVGWFLDRAVEAEQFGLDWGDIMMVVTPEEETALRKRIVAAYKGRRRLK